MSALQVIVVRFAIMTVILIYHSLAHPSDDIVCVMNMTRYLLYKVTMPLRLPNYSCFVATVLLECQIGRRIAVSLLTSSNNIAIFNSLSGDI